MAQCAPSCAPSAAVPGAPVYANGSYVVNQNFVPGLYFSESGSPCYWERLSGHGGTLGEIIENDNSCRPAHRPRSVPTDAAVRVGRVRATGRSSAPPVHARVDRRRRLARGEPDGRQRCGSPSRRATCYWERASGFTPQQRGHRQHDVERPRSSIVQTLPSDARFSSNGCGTWVPFNPPLQRRSRSRRRLGRRPPDGSPAGGRRTPRASATGSGRTATRTCPARSSPAAPSPSGGVVVDVAPSDVRFTSSRLRRRGPGSADPARPGRLQSRLRRGASRRRAPHVTHRHRRRPPCPHQVDAHPTPRPRPLGRGRRRRLVRAPRLHRRRPQLALPVRGDRPRRAPRSPRRRRRGQGPAHRCLRAGGGGRRSGQAAAAAAPRRRVAGGDRRPRRRGPLRRRRHHRRPSSTSSPCAAVRQPNTPQTTRARATTTAAADEDVVGGSGPELPVRVEAHGRQYRPRDELGDAAGRPRRRDRDGDDEPPGEEERGQRGDVGRAAGDVPRDRAPTTRTASSC